MERPPARSEPVPQPLGDVVSLAALDRCVAAPGDSLIFWELTRGGDEDGLGTQFLIVARADSATGWLVEGTMSPGLRARLPAVRDLRANPVDSTFTFDILDYPDTARFRVRISCRELTGTLWHAGEERSVLAVRAGMMGVPPG